MKTDLLVTILKAFAACENRDAKKYLRLAGQKLFDELVDNNRTPTTFLVRYIPEVHVTSFPEFWAKIPDPEEESAGMHKGKIEAVRNYKYRTGHSLMESKRIIEAHFANKGLRFYRS